MPNGLVVLCLAIAFIAFILEGLKVDHPRIRWVGIGLAAWVLVPLVAALKLL